MGFFDSIRASVARAIAPKRMSGGHRAASSGRRTAPLGAVTQGPNSLATQDVEKLRQRARAAEINDPYAESAIEGWKTDAVGVGITPVWLHPNAKFNTELKKHWKRWEKRADFDGRFDLGGRLGLILGSTVRDGEALVRRRLIKGRKGVVGLELQQLEPDHLPLDTFGGRFEAPDNHYVVGGVEFNRIGKRAAYHIYKQHPNETYVTGNLAEMERVPADQMIHFHRPKRAGECRSNSWMASSLTRLGQLNDMDDATLARVSIASRVSGFIEGASQSDPMLPATPGTTTTSGVMNADLESGTVIELAPGEKITFPDLPDMGSNYSEFSNMNLRAVAAGMGRTEWGVSGDFSRVNYSSIRAGESKINRRTETVQWGVFIPQVVRPIVEWFLFAGTYDGTFSAELANAYLNNPEEFEVDFTTHGFPFVDPLKESLAAANDVKHGFTTRSAVIRQRGENPEDVDRENADDKAREQKLKLTYGEVPKTPPRESNGTRKATAAAIQASLFDDPPASQFKQ